MEDSGIDSGDHNGDQKQHQISDRFPVRDLSFPNAIKVIIV